MPSGAALALAPELIRFVKVGTEGARGKFALFFDWTQTAQILIHRDGRTALVALALVILAVAIAAFHRKDRIVLVKLAAIYVIVMMLDPAMKAAGRSLEPVLPVIVLSTSYYSYVFAPIVLAAFLCVGFRHLRGVTDRRVVGGAVADCAQADLEECRPSLRQGKSPICRSSVSWRTS